MTDWRTVLASDEWVAQMRATDRVVGARAEVIDADGLHLADIHPVDAAVSFEGDASERWEAGLQMADDYPVTVDDMLHPLAGNQVRLWWREMLPSGWVEVPCMTGWPEDPGGKKSPGLTWSLKVLDTLTRVKRSGYGGQVLEVGGLTCDAALSALFDLLAPWAEHSFPATNVTLPATYTLGTSDDVEDDWSKIATVAGWTVFSDRLGAITAGPAPEGGAAKVDWQEGDGCRVVEMSFEVKTSGIKNAWRAVSSSAEVVPQITGTATDDDPGSPTWVGAYGPFWGEVSLDTIATQEAADAAAAAELAKSRRPAQTVTLTVPPRPDLDFGDVVSLGSPDVGVVGPYRVESWRLPLPGRAPEHMTVTMASKALG